MKKSSVFRSLLKGVALLVMLASASASPPGQDPRLLPLVPPGAEIVAGFTRGQPVSHLVVTRNNTTDLVDLESFAGVDPTRTIDAAIVITASGRRGFMSEHSLVASGHFDTSRIFKAAKENGSTESEYLGIPVLIVPPPNRNKGVSDDVRWFAVIDSQIAVFGTIPMVRVELSRSLAGSPADPSLTREISFLRSHDQSWCVLSAAVHRMEVARRFLAEVDPALGQAGFVNDRVILGIHFGREVEIEYEDVPNSGNPEDQAQTQLEGSQAPPPDTVPLASHFVGNSDTALPKVIRLSKKQYDQWIAREQAREQITRRTGSPPTR